MEWGVGILKWKEEVLYHSVLLVRTDWQELRRRKRRRKRVRDRWVVDRLRGQLERRTDRLRREGKKKRTEGKEMRLDEGGSKMVGSLKRPFDKPVGHIGSLQYI